MSLPARPNETSSSGAFPRQHRLRRQTDFDRVYQLGVHAADRLLVVRGYPNQLPYSRLGLSVSRKIGGAVLRNRWKRLIREAFRTSQAAIPAGWDLVVRPRRGAELPQLQALTATLQKLSQRIARQCDKSL